MVQAMKRSLALVGLLLSSILPVNGAGTYTPAAMLSAPRRSVGLPNAAGTLALYTDSTYNFTTHSRKYGAYVLKTADGSYTQWSNSSAVSDFNWLGDENKIAYLQGEDDGTTSIYVGDATKPQSAYVTPS